VAGIEKDGSPAKKKTFRAAEQDRPDVKEQREAWKETMPSIPPERLVFIDESGAKTNMTRLYARSFDGKRVVDSVPNSRWSTTTMISAIRWDARNASVVVDGPTDGDVFRCYTNQILLPLLEPNDVVVMDNLAAHKVSGIREAIESTGAAVRYLPPYSPDLNPIEKMWAKVKAYLRKEKARTKDVLWNVIGDALKTVTPSDTAGWFASCGYTQS
jgi:transposase